MYSKYLNLMWYQPLANHCTVNLRLRQGEAAFYTVLLQGRDSRLIER